MIRAGNTARSPGGARVAAGCRDHQQLDLRELRRTYLPPVVSARLRHVLDIVQPHVVHVHNLLNLSFDLPAVARERGISIVATLHDFTLVPSWAPRAPLVLLQ
jgi:hypothetical protein